VLLLTVTGFILLGARPATPEAIRSTTYRDALGYDLAPGPWPHRIVSLSPNLTEILFAIGVDPDRIVGVTRFCDHPPEALEVERVGGIVDLSLEKTVSLRPDLILATRGNPTETLSQMRAAGQQVFAFEAEGGIDLLIRTVEMMGQIIGPDAATRADSLADELQRRAECLRAISSTVPGSTRVSVFYYDPVSPDWTAGPGTHISEVIDLAGGRNAASDAPVAWPRYSLERLLVRQPDLLLVAAERTDATDALLDELRGRPGWRGLRAVREGRVCLVPADWLMRPGPRILGAVEMLARCLHPEQSWECGR
jgi:iron complex transport system substrate-binding protein